MDWLYLSLCIIIGYFIGAIPFCWILVKIRTKGKIDLRTFGSTTVGGRNAIRATGKVVGLTALILDVIKGLVTVIVLDLLELGGDEHMLGIAIAGAFAIAGHNYPWILKFHGGRGVATSIGIALYLNIFYAIFAILLLMVLLTFVKYMPYAYSLGYVIIVPITYYFLDYIALFYGSPMPNSEASIMMAGIAVFILSRQWDNIQKVRAKEIKKVDIIAALFKGKRDELMK